jgi:Putative MetA-pathway of phenol degradation
MKGFALAAAFFIALPGAAEPRGLCAERPGLATPPCTVDAGHLQIETGIGDWTHDRSRAERSDAVTVGETELRYGVTDDFEARVGWTPYGWVRTRDRRTDETARDDGVGDLTLGVKANPIDLGALSIALLPFATAPTGRRPIGAGDWGFGLLAPVAYQLLEGVDLEVTPEVDAAVDGDGTGRHVAFGGPVGLDADVTKHLALAAEVAAVRDREPSHHTTSVLAGFSAGWRPRDDWQLDVGVNLGLDRDAPDVEVYTGIAKWF